MSSDQSIIMVRRRLLEAVEINRRGDDPAGLIAADQRIRAATLVVSRNVPFEDLSRDILHTREGVPVTSV